MISKKEIMSLIFKLISKLDIIVIPFLLVNAGILSLILFFFKNYDAFRKSRDEPSSGSGF